MVETLDKSCHLDIQDLLTGSLHVIVLRNKRMGIDLSRQDEVTWCDMLEGCLDGMGASLGVDERGVLTTLCTQFLNVDLTHLELWLQGETGTFDEQLAILEQHRVAAIDHILC